MLNNIAPSTLSTIIPTTAAAVKAISSVVASAAPDAMQQLRGRTFGADGNAGSSGVSPAVFLVPIGAAIALGLTAIGVSACRRQRQPADLEAPPAYDAALAAGATELAPLPSRPASVMLPEVKPFEMV